MTDTLNRGYPYPLPTADPDVPYWLQRLAEDVDTDVQDLLDNVLTVDYSDGLANGTTSSRYTRQRIGAEGTVTAHIVVALGSNTLPANTAANMLLVAACVPDGYRPAYTVGNSPAVISGAGRGDNVQYQVLTNGDLTLRSGAATFTTISGSTLMIDCTWRWNGVL